MYVIIASFRISCHSYHCLGPLVSQLAMTIDYFSPRQLVWLLLILQELVLMEEASRSNPDGFLLCPNYVLSLVMMSYLLFLEGTKGYGNSLYFGGSFLDSSDQLKRRFPMPGIGLLLDSLWLLRGYPKWHNFN